jgi:hypothetical protein
MKHFTGVSAIPDATLPVACCLLSVASGEQKRELMRPILDPFRPLSSP